MDERGWREKRERKKFEIEKSVDLPGIRKT